MAQNLINIQYALIPAGGAQQAPPVGQAYHLPASTLVGNITHQRSDRRLINQHKRSMGIPPHPPKHPGPTYLAWRDAVKDQLLARGYNSDLARFPDVEFQQIVAGMRRLKPACDVLATAAAANNLAAMQDADEAVLQLVKDCGKKLTTTLRNKNAVPPAGPGVPPAQVVMNALLLPLNAPPQCPWAIATAVQNAGAVVVNPPPGNPPGPGQNPPAPPANVLAQLNPPPVANPPGPGQNPPAPPANVQAQLNPPPVVNPPGPGQNPPAPPANVQAQLNPPPVANAPGPPQNVPAPPANVQAQLNAPPVANPPGPGQNPHAPPANVQVPMIPPIVPNAQGPAPDVPAPPVDVEDDDDAALFVEDPGFVYPDVARQVPGAALNLNGINWSALLGRPRAVRIVWVCHPASSNAPRPKYRNLNWRNPHINGVRFAELVSHDIRGLSAIIHRTVPHNEIRYILGATGEGRQELRLHPGFPISYIDYVFIENDEDVRSWLLSNPVLEDPLDLLVYCHRVVSNDREVTPPLKRQPYLPENAVADWARGAAGPDIAQAARKNARAHPGPPKAGGVHQLGNDSPLFLPGSSSSSSDVSDAEDHGDASIRTSTSPFLERSESPVFRIPLAIQTPSRVNTHQVSSLTGRGGHTLDDKVRKRRRHSDAEDFGDHMSKKLRSVSVVKEFLKTKMERKRGALFDDFKDGEKPSSMKRLRLSLADEFGGSEWRSMSS